MAGWLCDATSGHPSKWHPGCHVVPLNDTIEHRFNKRCPCEPVNVRPFLVDESFKPVESGLWLHPAKDGRPFDPSTPASDLLAFDRKVNRCVHGINLDLAGCGKCEVIS